MDTTFKESTVTHLTDYLNEEQLNDRGLIRGQDGLVRPTWAAGEQLLRDYYDHEWGFPVTDEAGLFERLCLEGFQSGLSWAVVLRKRPAFRAAFAGFDPEKVATFDEAKIEALAHDRSIIRNRLKIRAVVRNAHATLDLREEGGLSKLIWSFAPEDFPAPHSLADIPSQSHESVALARALKKKGFTFVGPTTMFALMEAVGIINTHVVGSHRRPA